MCDELWIAYNYRIADIPQISGRTGDNERIVQQTDGSGWGTVAYSNPVSM